MPFNEAAILNISAVRTSAWKTNVGGAIKDVQLLKEAAGAISGKGVGGVGDAAAKTKGQTAGLAQTIENLNASILKLNASSANYQKAAAATAAAHNKTAAAAKNNASASGLVNAKNKEGVLGFVALAKAQAKFLVSSLALFAVFRKVAEAIGRVTELSRELARVYTVAQSSTLTLTEQQNSLRGAVKSTTTEFGVSIKETSDALFTLGSAGLAVEESLAALVPVMNLAIGTVADMGSTAKTVAGIFKVFGESLAGTNVEKFTRITDVLAAAFKRSLVETSDLVQGFKFLGPAAVAAGFSLEQTTSVLTVLNDNLIKSGQAGRVARGALLQLIVEADKVREAFGVSFEVGNFDSLLDVLGVIRAGLESTDAAVRASTLTQIGEIFGRRATPGVIVLAKNMDGLNESIAALGPAADGTAESFRKIQTASLAGQFRILNQTILNLVSSGFVKIGEVIRIILIPINIFLELIVKLDESFRGGLGTIATFALAFWALGKAVGSIILQPLITATNGVKFSMEQVAIRSRLAAFSFDIVSVRAQVLSARMLVLNAALIRIRKSLLLVGAAIKTFFMPLAIKLILVLAGLVIGYMRWRDEQDRAARSTKKTTEELEKQFAVASKQVRSIEAIVDKLHAQEIALFANASALKEDRQEKEFGATASRTLANSVLGTTQAINENILTLQNARQNVADFGENIAAAELKLAGLNSELSAVNVAGELDLLGTTTAGTEEVIAGIASEIAIASQELDGFQAGSVLASNQLRELEGIVKNTDGSMSTWGLTMDEVVDVVSEATIAGEANTKNLRELTGAGIEAAEAALFRAKAVRDQVEAEKVAAAEGAKLVTFFEDINAEAGRLPAVQKEFKELNNKLADMTRQESAVGRLLVRFGGMRAVVEGTKRRIAELGGVILDTTTNQKKHADELERLIEGLGGIERVQRLFPLALQTAFAALGEEGTKLKERLEAYADALVESKIRSIEAAGAVTRLAEANKAAVAANISVIDSELRTTLALKEKAAAVREVIAAGAATKEQDTTAIQEIKLEQELVKVATESAQKRSELAIQQAKNFEIHSHTRLQQSTALEAELTKLAIEGMKKRTEFAIAEAVILGIEETARINRQIALEADLTNAVIEGINKRQAESEKAATIEAGIAANTRDRQLKTIGGEEGSAAKRAQILEDFKNKSQTIDLQRLKSSLDTQQKINDALRDGIATNLEIQIEAGNEINSIRDAAIVDREKISKDSIKAIAKIREDAITAVEKIEIDSINKVEDVRKDAAAERLSDIDDIRAAERDSLKGAERLAQVEFDIRRKLGEASSDTILAIDVEGLDIAKQSIEEAKALLSEIPKQAIEENGKVVVSEQDLADIRITLLKKIQGFNQDIRNREVGLIRENADIEKAAVGDAKDTAITLEKALAAEQKRTIEEVSAVRIAALDKAAESARETAGIQRAALKTGEQAARDFAGQVDFLRDTLIKAADDTLASSLGKITVSIANLVSADAQQKLQDYTLMVERAATAWGKISGTTVPDVPGGTDGSARYGGPIPGYGGGDILRYMLEPGEFVMPKESASYYGDSVMNALRQKLIPPNFFGGQNTAGEEGGSQMVINITPDVLRNTKDMSEDDMRKFTRKLVGHIKQEMSRTYRGRSAKGAN